MVLMDTSPNSDSAQRQAVRNKQIETVKPQSDLVRILAQELKPNCIYDRSLNEHVIKLCMIMAMDLGCKIFINNCLAFRNRQSLTDTLSFIDCKTSVFCGEYHKLCPVTLHKELDAKIPDTELSIILICRYLRILEKTKPSIKILAFLS